MRNMLRTVTLAGAMVFLTLALLGCSNRYVEPLPASVQVGATYYNQVGMYYQKGRYRTTNYGVGVFLPVNTAVKLTEFGRKSFFVQVEKTGEIIEIENVPKYTKWPITEAFETLFSPRQVSLVKFNSIERKNIAAGTIGKGMRKSAVIVARGYPPSHETPSLQRDQWKYWKNRWDTIIVSFQNDRVVNIKD